MIQDDHGVLVHGDGAQVLGVPAELDNHKNDEQAMQSEIEEDYEI